MCFLRNILRTPKWPNTFEWLLMKFEILKDLFIQFIKKIDDSKTSIQQEKIKYKRSSAENVPVE